MRTKKIPGLVLPEPEVPTPAPPSPTNPDAEPMEPIMLALLEGIGGPVSIGGSIKEALNDVFSEPPERRLPPPSTRVACIEAMNAKHAEIEAMKADVEVAQRELDSLIQLHNRLPAKNA